MDSPLFLATEELSKIDLLKAFTSERIRLSSESLYKLSRRSSRDL